MMHATEPGVTVHVTRLCKNGAVVIKVEAGDDVLAVDEVRVLRSVDREKFAEALCAKYPGIPKDLLLANLARIAETVAGGDAESQDRSPDPLAGTPESVKAEALGMLRSPELIRHVVDDIAATGVIGEPRLVAAIYLIGTSRLLERPLAGIVQGPTSSGKSYIVTRTARLFPPEMVILAHKMTPEALIHMPPGSLAHRFVVAGERTQRRGDDAVEATRALREMLSDGELTKLMPRKGPNGQIETVQIHQQGPIAYVESTTHQAILDEDRNRCVVFNTDESPEQTRRIIQCQAQRRSAVGLTGSGTEVLERHHAAQRLLRRVHVLIPFAERLGECFPAQRTDARRSFGHLLSMIEAVACLYQFQRGDIPIDGSVVPAAREDYEIARYLLAEPMARSATGGLSSAARRFLERLREQVAGDFTTADAQRGETVVGDIQTIRGYVRELAGRGYLMVVQEGRGNKPALYRLSERPVPAAWDCGLPEPELLFGDTGNALSARQRVDA